MKRTFLYNEKGKQDNRSGCIYIAPFIMERIIRLNFIGGGGVEGWRGAFITYYD